MAKETLETVLKLKDQMSKEIKKVEKTFDGFTKKIEESTETFDGVDKGINKTTKSIVNLNNIIKGAVIYKLLSFMKKITIGTLEASSNMTELENVTTQVFGNMSKEVEEFAKKVGSEMGRSVYSMKKYTSDMGAVLKGLGGIDTSTIKDMSQSLAALAVDIGSFKNIDDSQAFNALRGGIVGETEALKTLGIVINDTVMKEYALRNGFKQSWETMDATTKAQIRFNAIMEKTSFMQGDAARTIDSYANRLKVFEANIGNLAVTLGDKAVPYANSFLGAINKIIKSTNDWLTTKTDNEILSNAFGKKAELDYYVDRYSKLQDKIKKVDKKTIEYKNTQEELKIVQQKLIDINPDFLNVFDEQGNRLEAVQKVYQATIKKIGEYMYAEKQAMLQKRITEKSDDVNKFIDKTADSRRNLRKDIYEKFNGEISSELVDDLIDNLGKGLKNAVQTLKNKGKYSNTELSKLEGIYSNKASTITGAIALTHDYSKAVENAKKVTLINDIGEYETKTKKATELLKKELDEVEKEKKEFLKIIEKLGFGNPVDNSKVVGYKPVKKVVVSSKSRQDNDNAVKSKNNNSISYEKELSHMVSTFGKGSEQVLKFMLFHFNKQLNDLLKSKKYNKDNALKLKNEINKLEKDIKALSEDKVKKQLEQIREDLSDLDKYISIKKFKDSLNTVEIDLGSQKEKIKENFKDSIEKLQFQMKKNGIGVNFSNNLKGVERYLETNDYSKLSKSEKIYFDKMLSFYITATNNIKQIEAKEKKLVEDRKNDIIKNIGLVTDNLKNSLNSISNLFPKNQEMQQATNAINGVIENVTNIGVAAATQNWGKVVTSSLSLIFGWIKVAVESVKDYSKEIEKAYSERKELNDNLATFNKFRNALNNLTDTILESTSKLATDSNIAKHKDILKELNNLYSNKGLNQDVVVNGSYKRHLQFGSNNTASMIKRIFAGIFSLGLSEAITNRHKTFSEKFKFDDIVKLKGLSSSQLKNKYSNLSETELEKMVKQKTLDIITKKYKYFNDKNIAMELGKTFKFNGKQIKEQLEKYIKQVEKQEQEIANFTNNSLLESLDGISVVNVNKEKNKILNYFKEIIGNDEEYNKILPELEKKATELLKGKQEIVTAFNDVRTNAVQQLSNGNSVVDSLTTSMLSYFSKLRNNISKMQLDSKNGILQGLDESFNDKFSKIAKELVKARENNRKINKNEFDFTNEFRRLKELSNVTNETVEIVKELRKQALASGIDKSLVDKFLPLPEIENKAKKVSEAVKNAMRTALETSSFNQFSMSLGKSLYNNVTESLVAAFTDSATYKKLVEKFVLTPEIKSNFENAKTFKEAYDIMKRAQTQTENMLKSQGLDFRSTNSQTGEYLGGGLKNTSENLKSFGNSGFNVNITNNIDNKGFLSVDDLSNYIVQKTKNQIFTDSKKEV